MKFDLIDWAGEHLLMIDCVIMIFLLLAMVYVAIKSKYKVTIGVWIESFVFGFIALSVFTTIFFAFPSLLSKTFYETTPIFLSHACVFGLCFSYFSMTFYADIFAFREDTKTGIRLNQWFESKRVHKKEGKDQGEKLQ